MAVSGTRPPAEQTPSARRRIPTPFSLLSEHVTLPPVVLHWSAFASIVASVLIVIGGGVVRVTGSGLGCPTWPRCTGDDLAPTDAMGVHGVIEFSNRMLTFVLCFAVAALIISGRLQRNPDRIVMRAAWAQFWFVVLNAVVGGITVLVRLSPYMVATHFVAAMLLVTASTIAWHRVRQLEDPAETPPDPGPRVRKLALALAVSTVLLVVAGTVVTGAGPHAGDADIPRFSVDWTGMTVVHGILAAVTIGLTVAIIVELRRAGVSPGSMGLRRAWLLLVVLLAQGAIGIYQALNGVPDVAVVLHLAGATLVWIGATRVVLDARVVRAPADELVAAPSR
jgi:cytochrome c oxidase assembly protein subunit 15